MKTFIKKFLCFVLAAIMVAGLFPVTANAAAALVISSPDNWEHVSKSDPPNLKWNKISGAPGYLVTVKNDATGEYYTEREKTTKNSYSLENLFDDELGSSEYPRLKIWVGALNSDGTDSNSQDIIYVIVSEYPDVTFNSCSSVTSDGATLKMTINKDYGSPIEDCGFYIGTSSSVSSMKKYSFADYGSYDATTKGTKIMTVTGLNPNTKYYVRAYAENGVGEEYTGTKTFTTKEAEGFLSLSKTSINWEYDFENEETVTVNCSGSYYVDDVYYELSSASLNKDHDYEWLDVDESGNSITIRPTRPNYSKYARTAEITVTSGSQSKDIFVKQAACEESAPTMTLKRGNTVLTDGMNLGAFTVGQPVMEAAIVSNNVRKVSAQLRPKTSTATDALDYSTKLDFISLDISDLPAGDYKVTVYASNSDTANDYWSQSPFSDGSMEFYFSLVDKNSGGGNDGGDNSDFPKSYSEAENMVIFSENKVPQNVKKGKIRHIPQVKSADPKFCDEYWIGYDENGNEYNTVSGAIRYCTRSVYSMVLSYFGIDCTPGKMAALMKTSGEIDGNNYDQVTTILKKTYNNLSYANKGDLHDLFENYANDKSFSPVYVYFGPHDYNGKHSTGHAILVIGRDPSNPNKYYCVEPDYGTGGNITTMVVNDSATKTTEYTWASCRGREILYCYQWKYSGSNDEETKTYTITYNANGGSGAPSAQTKTENKALTLSTAKPTRSGYMFDGWATSASASTAQYQPGGSYTANANVTLYAVWKTKEHTYVEEVTDPTCTEKGYITYTCSECGYSYVGNYVNATGHDYCSWYRTADPTCTEKGSEQRDCYNCYHYETREVNANGHDYRSEKVAPTCSEKGYTLHTCYDCGESYVDSYVDMTAHVFGDWYYTVYPTCTEEGSEQRDCYNCYHYETREVDANGHDYRSEKVAPTCSEKGYTLHTCYDCGESYVDSYVDMAAHVFGDWYYTVYPTCTEEGSEQRDCYNCYHYETREVDANGHDYRSEKVAPTCSEKGYTLHTCYDCGESYVDSYVDMVAHVFCDWYRTADPTCTEEGSEQRDCYNCYHYETREVNANGHDYRSEKVTPTCSEKGYTLHTCYDCGESYVDSYVDMVAHVFCDWYRTADPTCTEKGSEQRDCYNCYHYETRKVNATGHNFNEWEVITEATYIRKGEERRYCKKCSYYESREIPVLEKDGTYTVSYNANGGSGAPSAQTKTENKALTLSTTKPTRSGYEFLGWAASANAGTAQYQPGASYTANANVTLYAVWKQKEVIPADAPTIIIGEVSGRAGETVEVPVYVKNNPNMAVIGFDIEYDDEYIKLTDYKNSGLSDWLIGIGEGEKANWINEKGSSFNGEMLVLVFEVKEGIKEAEAEILFTNIKSGNVDGEKINFIIENGKIVISSGKPGDSNNDGEVDVFDLLVLRKHLAGMSTTINTGASDVNSDGEVDVFDLLMLRKYLAGMKVELL